MADINTIAQQFTAFYYHTFDNSRGDLNTLYRDQSTLTFEGQQIQGTVAIVEKLTGLPFMKVAHKVSTQDVQVSETSLVISITGQLLIDGESNPQFFTQTFVLKSEGASYYVLNDIFRLVYA